jgi:hypothetical protein
MQRGHAERRVDGSLIAPEAHRPGVVSLIGLSDEGRAGNGQDSGRGLVFGTETRKQIESAITAWLLACRWSSIEEQSIATPHDHFEVYSGEPV